ncbi:MAG: VacJ family lipoprotein [Methylophilaceae bacterium]|nr:VacJ family lipoprotein [Methylophilaceae bacterium]
MQIKFSKLILAFILVISATGCATQADRDPLEGINRGIYKFNDVTDKAIIKPVATAYKFVTPTPVRTGVNNFFGNINTFISTINNLLQLKFSNAFSEAGRFVINTTFGIGGLIDVASKDNIPKYKEDFGQTLGYWGVGNGPYLVLPILGPSTFRDTTGLVVDTMAFDPIGYLHDNDGVAASNILRVVQVVDKRAELLPASDLLDSASLDPYAFMRDAYLQRRASQVQGGSVPADLLKDDFEDAAPKNGKPSSSVERPAATTIIVDSAPPAEFHDNANVETKAEVMLNTVNMDPVVQHDVVSVDHIQQNSQGK